MIIAEYCEKIGQHELQAAHAEEERRILREELWRQQMDFREVHQQSLTEMEELRKFQSSTFDTLARRKLIDNQNTIMELSDGVQELQNEVNCMNDSTDFQDAESVRSGISLVTSRPLSFTPHPIPEGMLRPSFISPRRKEGPPCIWDTHGISGNVFANPHASSSAPHTQELNSWGTTIEEPLHMSTTEKSERQEQNRDLRCQSGPSAKDSVIFSGGDSSKNYGADQQRLQISDLHFDKFPTPATFACWKIRFKTEVCTCSQFPTEGMLWIKEVELVDSVDELRSSSSTRGISMPNFEVLDARIASALNRIIHNSHFKRRISLEEHQAQKQDSFLRRRQIAYLICRGIKPCTSYSRTNDYVILWLRHCTIVSHRTCGSSPPCTRHPIHACAPVCCVVVVFSSLVSVLYFVPPFFFQPFQMFTSVFNERSRSNHLCDFRLGTVATSDHDTPLTGYEPNKDSNLVNTDELDLAATSDVYWQHTLDDDASLNDPDVDDNQLAKYLAVVVDSTGKPVEMRSNNDQFSSDTRNLKNAQNQFPLVTQPEMICQTGGSVQARIAEERESAHAQIRTMLDEQRRTIIAECNEKVLHHELLAAHAEQDRKVLQEELLRQQQDFREVHQQDLMKHLELQKFQNSAFDEFTQKKFIEDQKTIMELSGRLQELLNEVNFMNDSKDFMDAESICSGNPHVTSPPGVFPRHPPFEGMLKPAFISQRQIEEPPNIRDTSGTSGNVFAHPQASSSAPYPQELNSKVPEVRAPW